MDLKIIEPVQRYVKEFESPEEFNVFYAKNKDEIDGHGVAVGYNPELMFRNFKTTLCS